MRLIALMPARNEDWIIGLTARAVLQWVDHLIVLNHASTDATGQILWSIGQENPDRVTVLNETCETWAEMAHRQRLLEEGRRQGGTHFALIDADELLAGGSTRDFIRVCTERLAPGKFILLPLRAMWRTINQYRQDESVWSRARATVTFADHPSLCWQTAGGYDYHHREPYGSTLGQRLHVQHGGLLHLQWCNWRRMTAKHALYKMSEVIRWPERRSNSMVDREYNQAVDERGIATVYTPDEWLAPYRDLLHQLKTDGEPWQQAECRRLWEGHCGKKFAGLNLFGVIEQCQEITAS